MPELVLSVTRPTMRIIPHVGHGDRKDAALAAARDDVLGQPRFSRRCVFCNYQFGRVADECELFHVDGDHGNDRIDNLVPACLYCHAPAHLDLATKRWPDNPGQMIWLPELTQAELSSLMQAIVFALSVQNTASSGASAPASMESLCGLSIAPYSVYMRLAARSAQVEAPVPGAAKVREGLSQPAVMARVLAAMNDDDYAQRDRLLAGVRYLAPLEPLIESAAQWPLDGGAFSRLDLASWAALGAPAGEPHGG